MRRHPRLRATLTADSATYLFIPDLRVAITPASPTPIRTSLFGDMRAIAKSTPELRMVSPNLARWRLAGSDGSVRLMQTATVRCSAAAPYPAGKSLSP